MKQLISFLLLSSLVLCGQALANKQNTTENRTERRLHAELQALFPQQPIDQVQESVLPGFYAVRSGMNFAYLSKDGHYLLVGDVLDLKKDPNNRNIAEESRRQLRAEALPLLQKQVFISYKPKEVKGVVTVFTDPSCPYCQKFHQEIPALLAAGVEVRYLAFPRQGIESPTGTTLANVWCAKEPNLAMDKVMKGETIESATCATSKHLAGELELGRQLGVSGTPALVLEDGTVIPGYRAAADLVPQLIKPVSR